MRAADADALAQDWQVQVAQLGRMVNFAAMKGYYINASGLTKLEGDPRFLNPWLAGGMPHFIETWFKRRKLRVPLALTIHCGNADMAADWLAAGRPQVRADTWVTIDVPTTKPYAPLSAAIMLVARTIQRKGEKRPSSPRSGHIDRIQKAAQDEFQGQGENALRTLVGFLDMPQHQAILKGE